MQLFRRHAGPLLVLAALVAIPQLLISLAMSSAMPATDATDPMATLGPAFGLLLPGFVVLLVWLSLGFGAMVHMGAAAYMGGDPGDALDSLRRGARSTRPLVVANLLGYLRAMIVALLLLFILSLPLGVLAARAGGGSLPPLVQIILAGVTGALVLALFCVELGRVLLATPAVMLEENGGLGALKRGRALTAGYVARAAVLVFVTALIGFAISLGSLFLAGTLPTALASVVASVLMLPLYPIIACVVVVMYYDLRVRKEGFDIDLLAGAPAGAPVA